MNPFCGATDTPVLDFWWHLPWVSKPGWIPCMLSRLCDPQTHLWCNSCWLYRGQHDSWAFLIHILADVSASIGGGSRLERSVHQRRITIYPYAKRNVRFVFAYSRHEWPLKAELPHVEGRINMLTLSLAYWKLLVTTAYTCFKSQYTAPRQ